MQETELLQSIAARSTQRILRLNTDFCRSSPLKRTRPGGPGVLDWAVSLRAELRVSEVERCRRRV